MSAADEIGPGIYVVAGPDITDSRDAYAYLVADNHRLALIDAGAGPSYRKIISNIQSAGFEPALIDFVIATHGHIDHIGSLADFARDYNPEIVAHSLDAPAMEKADPHFTAAAWYGLKLKPVQVTIKIPGDEMILELGQSKLVCLHAPGHTPGSMVVYLDRDEKRYLFGQDIHGPFDPSFQSDIRTWQDSMRRVLTLKADVLGEGHYGIYYGADEVSRFIEGFLFKHKNSF